MGGTISVFSYVSGCQKKKVLLKLYSAMVGRIQVHERKLCLRFFFLNCSNVTAIIFGDGSSLLLR